MDRYDAAESTALLPGVDLALWITMFVTGLLVALTVTVVGLSLS